MVCINVEFQPYLAQIIHDTSVNVGNIYVKFSCVQEQGNFSAPINVYQTIGYKLGVDLYQEIDLDMFYNSYINPDDTTFFLLQMLQRHLGERMEFLSSPEEFDNLYNYFKDLFFPDEKILKELVLISAGIPRDFLPLFSLAWGLSPNGKLDLINLRRISHSVFDNEKMELIEREPDLMTLVNKIFADFCYKNKTYLFFVSAENANNESIKKLWYNRTIHLLIKNAMPFKFTGDARSTGLYNLYALDYGYYVQMKEGKLGEELVDSFVDLGRYLTEKLKEKLTFSSYPDSAYSGEIENKWKSTSQPFLPAQT